MSYFDGSCAAEGMGPPFWRKWWNGRGHPNLLD